MWLAAAAAVLAFLPSVLDGFVFDDQILIVRNPYAHGFSHLGRCFATDLWDTPERPVADASTKFYRPLVCASYIVNGALGGGAAWSFHLANVLLHAAVSALVARLALRWTGSSAAALVTALVFAAHPSRSENVVWISGRTDVLMVLFLLFAHELVVSAAKRGNAAKWAVAAASFALALLSKEFAVAWPFLIAVELALAGPRAEPGEQRRLARALALSLAGAALYLTIRSRFYPIRPPEIESMALPLPLHAAYVLLSLGYYAERIVFPWPQTFHFRPVAIVHGAPVLYMPSVLAGAVVALALAVSLARAWRRDRVLAAILASGIVLLLPIVNVSYTGFPGTTADRFLYLPLLPFAAGAARAGRAHLERWFGASRLAPLVVGSGVLLYAGVSWVRSLDYASNDAMWRHELEVNPNDPQALAGLAEVRASNGDSDGALQLLVRALSPEARKYGLLANPGRYYAALLELQASRLADGNVTALTALLDDIVAASEGRIPEVSRIGDVDVTPPADDEHVRIHLANAATHLRLAGAFVASRLGKDDLVRAFARAVGDAPVDASARYNLALALARASEFDAARAELERGRNSGATSEFAEASRGLLALLALLEQSRNAPTPRDSTLARAHAYFELGAYLRSARELRLTYLENPRDLDVAAPFVTALVWARLDADADQTAAVSFGADRGKDFVAKVRASLTPKTARAVAPGREEPWWIP